MMPLRRPAVGVLLAAVASCTTYDPADVALPTLAAGLARHDGPLTFESAVELALANNGELMARSAECRAAGLDVMPTELQGQLQQENLAAMVDPLALLGLTQRGASARLAEAQAFAAAAALATERWRVVAAIAEVFVASRALADLPAVPPVDVDVEALVAAGLASPLAARAVRAAVAGVEAERRAIQAEHATLAAELRRLLGLSSESRFELVLPPVDWPPVPPADETSVLRRPDLAEAQARYQVADAEFRRAVADQYPSLMIGPDFMLRGSGVDPMAILRWPIGAAGPAEASRERRGAARSRLLDALLAALGEANSAAARHEAAAARARATAATAQVAGQALAAATVALQVEVDAFDRVADTAPMMVREAMEARDAAMAAARARVRAAAAAGWPAMEEAR
ncbi:MAG: hypothetical protein JNL12_20235 [Planctomycetes bacterium]|nr:hypothetical protein [Planctomycetota bacterium]